MTLKVLELFAGIGACSKALTNLGIDHEIVDAVEIDRPAIQSFNAVHGTNFQAQDICTWDKDIDCDLILHGSPCQDYSVAGLQAGGDEGSGTRSSLMYESVRIIKKLMPKYVIWENVKNLLSINHVHNFEAYQKTLEDLGYINYYAVLNAKDYGVPQNRERVFTVSIRSDVPGAHDFKFPNRMPLVKKVADVLEDDVDPKYYLSQESQDKILATIKKKGIPEILDDIYKHRPIREYPKYAPTLRAAQACNLKVVYDDYNSRVRKDQDTIGTLTTNCGNEAVRNGWKIIDYGVRRLTPLEAWRLMGFSDDDFRRAEASGTTTSQLYKQAGNSIVVDVLMQILGQIFA